MDRKEVKRALHVFRPDELEPIPSPVADALDLAERDPRLKAWWEAEQAFDRAVADKLSDVPIPEDLRNSILASRTVVPIRPQPQFSFWLAAAAVFAICCTLGTSQLIKAMSPMPRGEYTAAILPLLNHDAPDLGLTSNDHDQIMTWLKARHAPTGSLPSKMTSLFHGRVPEILSAWAQRVPHLLCHGRWRHRPSFHRQERRLDGPARERRS